MKDFQSSSIDKKDGPLSGLMVLELAHGLAGPFAGTLLADFGADVIKVERPIKGDVMRQWDYAGGAWWKSISRGKRTIAIDLQNPESRPVMQDLVAKADVVIESFRPGVLERLGFGPDVLHQWNPNLHLLRISGYGQTGPYSERPGYGKAAEAFSGLLHMTGFPDGPPVYVGFPIADMTSGLMGAFGVLMARISSQQGMSKGQIIDLALYETVLRVMDFVVPMTTGSDIQLMRNGNRQPMDFAPSGIFKTRDDRWVLYSAASPEIVRRVLSVVAGEEHARQSKYESLSSIRENADEIEEMVRQWCAQYTGEQVVQHFTAAQAVAALVQTPKEIVQHPQVLARKSIAEVGEDGTKYVNVIPVLSETPGRIRSPGSMTVGADADYVLRDILGYESSKIESVVGSKAVFLPNNDSAQ